MKTIDTLLPAFGLSWSLRHPVPTGTSLTGGVHRRSDDILVVLHNRGSMGILSDFGTASAASESIGSLCASSVCLSVDLVVVCCLPSVTPYAPCRHAMKVSRSRPLCLSSTSLFRGDQTVSSL